MIGRPWLCAGLAADATSAWAMSRLGQLFLDPAAVPLRDLELGRVFGDLVRDATTQGIVLRRDDGTLPRRSPAKPALFGNTSSRMIHRVEAADRDQPGVRRCGGAALRVFFEGGGGNGR